MTKSTWSRCGLAAGLLALALPAGGQEVRGGVPTPTDVSRGTAARGTVARPLPGPAFMFRSQHYEALKPVLRQGDVAFAMCVRFPDLGGGPRAKPEGPPLHHDQLDPQRVTAAVASLTAITDPRITKAIVFSAVDDLMRYERDVPRDVAWIDYNSEPVMTPQHELQSPEKAVQQFADVVHKHGRLVAWAPTNMMLHQADDRPLALARYVDAVILQHQKVLQYDGGDAMVRLTQTRGAAIRHANPKCEVVVQMVVGRGTREEVVHAGRAVAPLTECICLFTSRDPGDAALIVRAIRGN